MLFLVIIISLPEKENQPSICPQSLLFLKKAKRRSRRIFYLLIFFSSLVNNRTWAEPTVSSNGILVTRDRSVCCTILVCKWTRTTLDANHLCLVGDQPQCFNQSIKEWTAFRDVLNKTSQTLPILLRISKKKKFFVFFFNVLFTATGTKPIKLAPFHHHHSPCKAKRKAATRSGGRRQRKHTTAFPHFTPARPQISCAVV